MAICDLVLCEKRLLSAMTRGAGCAKAMLAKEPQRSFGHGIACSFHVIVVAGRLGSRWDDQA